MCLGGFLDAVFAHVVDVVSALELPGAPPEASDDCGSRHIEWPSSVVVDEDVGRLQVPMHNSLLVHVLQRACDLTDVFYSVELSPSSIPKSAIITLWGLFEYLRSNFGFKDSMNVYCRMMQSVLGHRRHNEVINYVDDSIVLGETFERHLSFMECCNMRYQIIL